MTVALNEEVFTQIYSYTFDFEVLRVTATAIANNKHHPLRAVVLRRLLQLPLRLSNEYLKDSKELIDHFIHNPARARAVQNIVIGLEPSGRSFSGNEGNFRTVHGEKLGKGERTETLVDLLPELLRWTENLQHLDWSESFSPNREILEALSEHSIISHLSLDCSVGSEGPLELLTPDTRSK